jgi:hypothetical protein
MKNLAQYFTAIFLVIFLINPAFGFANMTADEPAAQPDFDNTTESDQDIILLQHLIEVDAVLLQSENKLYVKETLIFKNIGTKNFSGALRTWVQDGVEGIIAGKMAMVMGAVPEPIELIMNGNIIIWQDFLMANDPLPSLYFMEYVLPAEPEGTFSKTKNYSKVFLYSNLTKQPASLVLKVTKNKEESISLVDDKGNSIAASGNPVKEDDSVLYGWDMPQFKEFRVEISKPVFIPADTAGYVFLGLLIVLVFSYPIMRKKSEKIKAIEEKISNSLKRGEPGKGTEFEGKSRDELENLKTETLSKLDELEKEYSSGNLLDEEYEELRKAYQEKFKK